MNIIDKLKEINEDEFDVYSLEEETLNWPLIPLYMDYDEDGNPVPEEDPELEPVDLENWKIVEIGETHLILKCGGDWQEPHEIKIVLNGEQLEAVSCEPCDYEKGRPINMNELLGF